MDLLQVVSAGISAPTFQSVNILAAVLSYCVISTLAIPGPYFLGAPLKDNRPRVTYVLNGLRAHILAMILYIVGSDYCLNLYKATIIYDNYGPLLTTTVLWAFLFSAFLYLRAKFVIPKVDQNYQSDNFLVNFWCGVELNPHVLGFEVKCWSYRPGFILMSLINISVLAKQLELYHSVSTPMIMFQAISLFYVVDAFYFETGLVYMFDIIEENFGLMLIFGDYTWIPFVFSLQSLYLVKPTTVSTPYIILNVIVLLVGYWIFRGSNYQKLQFRLNPNKPINGKAPEVIKTGRPGRDLLISGWWGRARKINYTGDILIAIAMSMPCPLYVLAYLYPIYLTILLFNRAQRDDHRCREKHQQYWTEYCKRVPYILVPGVY
ncbi:delta(14)-sterol reductase [Acrasis kona]|uniref:Delta(14)-sterol reductase n=1 Tax=Acrasis kona TaxID=1008807 RepID=A0AAW2YLP3_9EUKA